MQREARMNVQAAGKPSAETAKAENNTCPLVFRRAFARGIWLMAGLTLGACAPRYTWYQPGLDPTTAARQLQIDSAECKVLAMRSVPQPRQPAVPPPAPPQNYSVNGTTTVYDSNGNSYTGTYNGTATSGAAAFDPARAEVEGVAAAQSMQDNYQAAKARHDLAVACMLRRGWEQVPTGRQQSQLAAPANAPSAAEQTPAAGSDVSVARSPASASYQPAQSYGEWLKGHGS